MLVIITILTVHDKKSEPGAHFKKCNVLAPSTRVNPSFAEIA